MDQACGKKPTVSVFLQGFLVGLVGLSAFYYVLLFAVTGDPKHPLDQFLLFRPWMSLLIVGFGIQFGLFWLLRRGYHFSLHDTQDARLATGTSSAVSGVAMVACCAHHVVDVLPILGFSAAAIFLSDYQEQLLILGVVANMIGIGFMGWYLSGKATPHAFVQVVTNKVRRII